MTTSKAFFTVKKKVKPAEDISNGVGMASPIFPSDGGKSPNPVDAVKVSKFMKDRKDGSGISAPSKVKNMIRWGEGDIKVDECFSNLNQTQTTFNDTTMLSELNAGVQNKDKPLCIRLSTTMMVHVVKGVYPQKTDKPCFWCRHTFDGQPLGIPLKWIPSTLNVTPPTYKVTDIKDVVQVTCKQVKKLLEDPEHRDNVTLNGYFECDGIFCSFNCMDAFILDETTNNMYKDSYTLIARMYKIVTGTYIDRKKKNHPAPHWRSLKLYEGTLSIEKFRLTFNSVKYTLTPNLIKPCGRVFEKIII
jgi:hypothetical protein